jgi:hypothetical protein
MAVLRRLHEHHWLSIYPSMWDDADGLELPICNEVILIQHCSDAYAGIVGADQGRLSGPPCSLHVSYNHIS